MENVNIDSIANIDTVKKLFSSVNGLAEDNCFLVVVNRDYGTADSLGGAYGANAVRVGAKNGGVAGGIIAGAVSNSVANVVNEAVAEFRSKLNDKQQIVFDTRNYGGYLLNITEKGIGVIPLSNNGKMIPSIKNFKTDIENYVYFANDEIEKIEIKKLALHFSSKRLAIYFKGLDQSSTPWQVYKKHKLVPYEEANYNKLVNKLK